MYKIHGGSVIINLSIFGWNYSMTKPKYSWYICKYECFFPFIKTTINKWKLIKFIDLNESLPPIWISFYFYSFSFYLNSQQICSLSRISVSHRISLLYRFTWVKTFRHHHHFLRTMLCHRFVCRAVFEIFFEELMTDHHYLLTVLCVPMMLYMDTLHG